LWLVTGVQTCALPIFQRGVLSRLGGCSRAFQLFGQVRDEFIGAIEQSRGLIEELPKFREARIVQGDLRTVESALETGV